jgi:mRNA-degrading endonuclease toxin of MazEF toxin-antitoxin module
MKQFDIFSWQPAGWPEPHPCVIVSHPDRANRKTPVEVIMCSSKRATRKAEPDEIILDEADGLDWPSICKCDLIHSVSRHDLKQSRGAVAELRRAPLVRTLIAAHGWGAVL